MASRAFGEEGPRRPHLIRGHGLSGEIRDLREDIDDSFSRMEDLTGYPVLTRVTGGGTPLPLAGLPVAKPLVGTDLLQGQSQASLEVGTGTAKLTFTSNRPGTPGNDISVEIIDSAGGGLAVSVAAGAIEIDKGGGSDDADAVKIALDADADILDLVTVVSGGVGEPAITAEANLAGGLGTGFDAYVNGIAQKLNGLVTDTGIPMLIDDLTGALAGDEVPVNIVSDSVTSNRLQLSVTADAEATPVVTKVTGGNSVSLGAIPLDKGIVGTGFLQGHTQATLAVGAGAAELALTANRPGTPGNAITFEIIDSAGGGGSVAVTASAIVYDKGGASDDANAVKVILDADTDFLALVTVVSGGAGEPVITAEAPLASGTGTGLSVKANGIEQVVNDTVTDTIIPLNVADLTGAANLDVVGLEVVSNGNAADVISLGVVT